MLDFRGYGKSSCRIESLAQLEAHVHATWASITPAYAGRRWRVDGHAAGFHVLGLAELGLEMRRPHL